MTKSIIFTKSKAFALRVVRLYKYLRDHKESVIAKQMKDGFCMAFEASEIERFA